MKRALLVFAILAIIWYAAIIVVPMNDGHPHFRFKERVKGELMKLASMAVQLDEDRLKQEVEKLNPLSYENNSYSFTYTIEDGIYTIEATPEERSVSSPIWRKILFLDFSRTEFKFYLIDTKDMEIKENR